MKIKKSKIATKSTVAKHFSYNVPRIANRLY